MMSYPLYTFSGSALTSHVCMLLIFVFFFVFFVFNYIIQIVVCQTPVIVNSEARVLILPGLVLQLAS